MCIFTRMTGILLSGQFCYLSYSTRRDCRQITLTICHYIQKLSGINMAINNAPDRYAGNESGSPGPHSHSRQAKVRKSFDIA